MRRAHQVWKAAVATSAIAENTSRYGPSGPLAMVLAIESATTTAVNIAASSMTSCRQWWLRRAFWTVFRSVMRSL